MSNQNPLQKTTAFARKLAEAGKRDEQLMLETTRYANSLVATVAEAQTVAWRAINIVESEINSRYLDLSFSTSTTAVVADPISGKKQSIPMTLMIRALQSMQNSCAM